MTPNETNTFKVTITVPPIQTDLRKLVLPLKPQTLLRMEARYQLLGGIGLALMAGGLIFLLGFSTPRLWGWSMVAVLAIVLSGVAFWYGGGNFIGAKMLWDRLTVDQRVLQNLVLSKLTFYHDQAPRLYTRDKDLRLKDEHDTPPEPSFRMYASMTEIAKEFDAALNTLKVELERALRPLGTYTRTQVELAALEDMLFKNGEVTSDLQRAMSELMRLDATLAQMWQKAHERPELRFELPEEMLRQTTIDHDALMAEHDEAQKLAA